MSSESITISKNKPAHESMDYAFLRQKGIEHIQKLASSTWTDHNPHDPGITILEALCYAMTELGYRTDYEIRDILSSSTENLEDNFYTPAQILPCNPLTINDFRKLVIDCNGLRNAWFEKPIKYEQDIYYDELTGELNFGTGSRVRLRGLYDIQLEFEETLIHKEGDESETRTEDLNSNIIKWSLIDENQIVHPFEVEFPYWDQISSNWTGEIGINRIEGNEQGSPVILEPYDDDDRYHYSSKLRFYHDELLVDKFEIRIKFTNPDSEFEQFTDRIMEVIDPQRGRLIRYFHDKIIATNDRVEVVRNKLNRYRNLCEDFYEFKAVRVQEIAVAASIDIVPGANSNEVLSKVYHKLNHFFNPSIAFYTLQELLDQGMSPDQIFDGPLLDHGFLRSEDLEILNRRDVIYTSDLINIIMEIEEVKSVKDLKIANYIYNQVINEDVSYCLKLIAPETYQAKLSIDKSAFEIMLNGLVVNTDPLEISHSDNAQEVGYKQLTTNDIEIPVGQDLDIEAYESLQSDFPLIYGIGEEGLPESSSEKRKNQAKQLKGYMLFFEQLIANHFSQLAHVTDLFSMSEKVNKTYFSQPLHMVPNVAELLNHNYENELQEKVEEESDFLKRRNQFLEHLIARFSEDFTEYTSYAKEKILPGQLISDKLSFLQHYPEISQNRGLALNYLSFRETNGTIHSNVSSGFEKRLSGLLGLPITEDSQILVIEHILLRPKCGKDLLLAKDEFIDEGDSQTPDPYSFRISVFLPKLEKFTEDASGSQSLNEFGRYAERVVKMETPAHIIPDIFWIDDEGRNQLKTVYEDWLNINAEENPDKDMLSQKLNALIEHMEKFD